MKAQLTFFFLIVIIMLLNLSMKSQVTCSPMFISTSNYTLNGSQWDIVTADFNEDGHLDLATANPSANCVNICLGYANGTFGAIANFTANVLTPYQIKSADFNGDGHLDLVMTNSNQYAAASSFGNQASIMMGAGNGSFSPATNFTVANNTTGIIAQDFNSDSKIDLLFSNGVDLQLHLGNGNGSFSAPTTFSSSGTPQYLTSKDFNGDGNPDVAVSTMGSDVLILLGTGTGSFNYATSISSGQLNSNNTIVESNDYDNDGKCDLIVGMVTTFTMIPPNTRFKLYLGLGNGSFTAASVNFFATGGLYATDIVSGDFNSDGAKDVVATFVNSSYPLVLPNDGTGNFSFGSPIYAPQDPRGVAVGDFNQDGKDDIAIANNNGYPAYVTTVYLNTTNFPSLHVSSSSSLICNDQQVNLIATGANTYSWSTGETDSTIIIHPSATSNFTLTGSLYSGCSTTYTFEQLVQQCTGIINRSNFQKMEFYPNPASREVFIKTQTNIPLNISISNSIGEIIYEKNFSEYEELRFVTANFGEGIYFVTVKENNKTVQQEKLIIQR